MRIAIIGSGIAGLVAAYHLSRDHDITVFEANDYIGGHTHTHDITFGDHTFAVDTGFIVFNDWTYPNFIALMKELGVDTQPTTMSFSVRCERTGLEYNGTSLNGLFAQRGNLVSPRFWAMLREIFRFNRDVKRILAGKGFDEHQTLAEFLAQHRYSQTMMQQYLVPMGAAIWSASPQRFEQFPIRFLASFLNNHGMLNVWNRPQWRTIRGGSKQYIAPLTQRFADRIRLSCPALGARRYPTHVDVRSPAGVEAFDHVVFACHSNQTLAILDDPTPEERDTLGALPYQLNEAVLHTDTSLLPRSRRAWAAWNYHIPREPGEHVAVTYNMNLLQNLDAPETFCVTLNQTDRIDPARILRRMRYAHPTYDAGQARAHANFDRINHCHRTSYCGAYWGFGFHEDGVKSGLRVAQAFNAHSGSASSVIGEKQGAR